MNKTKQTNNKCHPTHSWALVMKKISFLLKACNRWRLRTGPNLTRSTILWGFFCFFFFKLQLMKREHRKQNTGSAVHETLHSAQPIGQLLLLEQSPSWRGLSNVGKHTVSLANNTNRWYSLLSWSLNILLHPFPLHTELTKSLPRRTAPSVVNGMLSPSPKIHRLKPNASWLAFGGEVLGRGLGHESGAQMNGISVLIQEIWREIPSPFHHRRTQCTQHHLGTKRQVLSGHQICRCLDFGLTSLQNGEK